MKNILFLLLLIPSLVFGQATGKVISDKPSGGAIGTAAETVDILTSFNINQTTVGQTLTIPSLTNASAGKVIYINNTGSVTFTLNPGGSLPVGSGVILRWDGTRWSVCSPDPSDKIPYTGANRSPNLNQQNITNINRAGLDSVIGVTDLVIKSPDDIQLKTNVGSGNNIELTAYDISLNAAHDIGISALNDTLTTNAHLNYTKGDTIRIVSNENIELIGQSISDVLIECDDIDLESRDDIFINSGNIISSSSDTVYFKTKSLTISENTFTTTAASSAILDLKTTTKGLLIPRMTTTQRDAISTPATGLKIFNTTTGVDNYYDGANWTAFVVGTTPTFTSTTTQSLTVNGATANTFAGFNASKQLVSGGLTFTTTSSTTTVTTTGTAPTQTVTINAGGSSIYTGSGTVASGVVATITNSLTFTGGNFIRIGPGSTSGTTTALFQNSSGTQLFKCLDDGSMTIGSNAPLTNTALYIRKDFGAASTPLDIRNGQYGNYLFRVADLYSASAPYGKAYLSGQIEAADYSSNSFDLGGYGLGSTYGTGVYSMVLKASGAGTSSGAGGISLVAEDKIQLRTGSSATVRATIKATGVFNIEPITATAASAVTPSDGDIVFVSTTNGTFTAVGFWGYQGGAWLKM